MSTVTFAQNLKTELDHGNPNSVGDVLRAIKFGTMLTKQKQTITSLGSATAVDITSAAVAAAASPGPDTDTEPAAKTLPPIGQLISLRVTGSGGGNKPGMYILTDASATPYDAGATAVGVATLSDDGKTITFASAVTAFIIEYYPAPNVVMTTAFAVD